MPQYLHFKILETFTPDGVPVIVRELKAMGHYYR